MNCKIHIHAPYPQFSNGGTVHQCINCGKRYFERVETVQYLVPDDMATGQAIEQMRQGTMRTSYDGLLRMANGWLDSNGTKLTP